MVIYGNFVVKSQLRAKISVMEQFLASQLRPLCRKRKPDLVTYYYYSSELLTQPTALSMKIQIKSEN